MIFKSLTPCMRLGCLLPLGFVMLSAGITGLFVLPVFSAERLTESSGPDMLGANAQLMAKSSTPSSSDPYRALKPVPVGKPAPDFSVVSADETPIKLSQFRGKQNVVLIFYQGHFCGVCGKQLSNLQKHYQDFKAQQAEIVAVSADDMAHAQMTLGEKGLSFYIIPDHGLDLIKKYGVANVAKGNIAWPSAFIIDKKGIVRFSYADSTGHRLHSNDLLPELSKLTGKPAPAFAYDE